MVRIPQMSRSTRARINEEGIIGQIRRRFSCTNSQLLVGLGDDAAVVGPPQAPDSKRPLNVRSQVLATDILVEGVHFSLKTMDLREIGYKAVAVNVSDMAAMGAQCVFALGNLGVPRDADSGEVGQLLDGVSEALDEFGASLIGGDTVRAPQWLMSFSLIGSIDSDPLVRSGAQPGDLIWHSGELGLSQLGFHQMQAGIAIPGGLPRQAHIRPRPRLELGQWLSCEGLASACLDLSDSLSQCLLQLASASEVGMQIDLQDYPFHPELLAFVAELGRDSGEAPEIVIPEQMQSDEQSRSYGSIAELLLGSAEDYELLFTAPPSSSARLRSESPVPLRCLGTVLPQASGLHYADELGRNLELTSSGYMH